MKELMLMNPVTRRRRRKSSKRRTHRRRTHRGRFMRANPVSRRRRRRRSKRATIAHVIRYRRNPVGKRRGRRRGRRGGNGGGAITLKSLTSPDLLWMAGGAVAGGFLTSLVMRQFGPYKVGPGGVPIAKSATEFKLPMSDNPWGALAYNVLIPVLGAILFQRFNRNLAKGMVLGGAVLGVQSIVSVAQGALTATRGTSAYLDAGGRIRALPAGPGYNAVNAFSASPLDNAGAFRQNTWAVTKN